MSDGDRHGPSQLIHVNNIYTYIHHIYILMLAATAAAEGRNLYIYV